VISSEITDKRFIILPGPNGLLNAQQVQLLQTVAPDLQIKEGDPFRIVLSYAFGLFGDSDFDPDAY
jgi:hypothetical protein